MSSIPPFDVTQQYQLIGEDVSAAVLEVLASGGYIGGPVVQNFEQQFAHYIGTENCVSCNSGTDALYLALRALNIGAGDQVITTTFTFVAAAEMISAVGATPVFIDIDPHTFNLDLNQLEAAITDRTRAIIPVHQFGQPVDMTRLMAIANAHQLWVIEDCAQAIGATWAGQKVGSIGQIGCFSFYPTKNLGACGDAGAITTSDRALAERMRKLKNYGQQQRYIYEDLGVNSRMDAIQAAILTVKLRHLDRWNQQRQAIVQHYQQLLSPLPGIELPRAIAGGESVWHQYTIRVRPTAAFDSASNGTAGGTTYRDWLQQTLQQQGISTMVYYPLPLHLQPVYRSLGYRSGQLPVSEQVCQDVLSLPMFPELMPAQQEQIVYALKESLSP